MGPVFKSYLRNSLKGFLLSLIFPLVIFWIVKDKDIIYWFGFMDIIGFIPGYYRYKDQLEYEKKLKRKGLTTTDIENMKFVKDWDHIRKRGPIRYSLIDGGIFFGFAMCFLISIIIAFVKHDLMAYISTDPSNMFNFIGYTYLSGALVGIIIYRILWARNEQKFVRLTDPLH